MDPVYTFGGQVPHTQLFTAHPKIGSHTGNIVAFGYEAEGFGSDVVSVFEIDKTGRKTWETKIKVPYVGLLHDFAVTENYILFFVVPLAFDPEQIQGTAMPRAPTRTSRIEPSPAPVQASPQVHGWWVREDQYPT